MVFQSLDTFVTIFCVDDAGQSLKFGFAVVYRCQYGLSSVSGENVSHSLMDISLRELKGNSRFEFKYISMELGDCSLQIVAQPELMTNKEEPFDFSISSCFLGDVFKAVQNR